MIRISDHFKKINLLSKKFKGVVVDNNDPKKLGRVKISIPELFGENVEAENLIWVQPKLDSFQGGRIDISSFSVPEIGAELVVEFPNNDLYSAFYVGAWQSENTHQSEFNEDYPDSYGFRDKTGAGVFVNKAKQLVEAQDSLNNVLKSDKDGIEINFSKKVKLITDDGKLVLELDKDLGLVRIESQSSIHLKSNELQVESKGIVMRASEVNEEIAGSRVSRCAGGRKDLVGGSLSVAIVSNRAESIGGDSVLMIAGKEERVIAQDAKLQIVLGNYTVNITAGNCEISTTAGNVKIEATTGSVELNALAGTINVRGSTIDLSPTISGQAPQVPRGVLTCTTAPVIDLITGAPHFGLTNVLAG